MFCRGCGAVSIAFVILFFIGAVDSGDGRLELYYIFGGLRGG